VKAWALGALERLVSNFALYGGLALLAGVTIGIAAAMAGDGVVTGAESTAIHVPHPAHDPPGTPVTVTTPSDDPHAGFLLLYPILALYYSILGAPVIAGGLLFSELLGALRVPANWTRIAAVGLASLLAVTMLINEGSLGYALVAMAMVAFAALYRLPERTQDG
jgi:hypothetical protein